MQDPVKKEFADELLWYTDSFNRAVITSSIGKGREAGELN